MKDYNKNPIYVLNKDGVPLMPTFRRGKVRKMLKNKEAIVVKRDPFFTIQLLYNTNEYIQPLMAGMDIGQNIGLSVVSNNNEILSAVLETRSHKIPEKLEERASYRRTRRGKIRHRKARFENRGASKGTCKHCGCNSVSGKVFCRKCLREVDGIHQKYRNDTLTYNEKRLAPSVRHLINTHNTIQNEINSILPLSDSDWCIELTKFDIQKMEDINISGKAYQEGNLFGFSSLRDYILERDGYTCQNPDCKHKKSKNKDKSFIEKKIPLVLHHIVYRSKGGSDKSSNLITLCVDCHTPKNHQPGSFLWDWCIKHKRINKNYKPATTMNVVATSFYENKKSSFTYGSETKRKRQLLGLEKSHSNDAFSICFNKNNFEIYEDDEGKKNVKLKPNVLFKKIKTPEIIQQTNGRENGRRKLQSFFDAKYVDSRTGEIKTGNELSRNMNKRTLVSNDRLYRKEKVRKGKFVNRTGISKFPNKSIVKFIDDGKKYVRECGGMTNSNISVNNYKKKWLAVKKYDVSIVVKRNGLIRKNI